MGFDVFEVMLLENGKFVKKPASSKQFLRIYLPFLCWDV